MTNPANPSFTTYGEEHPNTKLSWWILHCQWLAKAKYWDDFKWRSNKSTPIWTSTVDVIFERKYLLKTQLCWYLCWISGGVYNFCINETQASVWKTSLLPKQPLSFSKLLKLWSQRLPKTNPQWKDSFHLKTMVKFPPWECRFVVPILKIVDVTITVMFFGASQWKESRSLGFVSFLASDFCCPRKNLGFFGATNPSKLWQSDPGGRRIISWSSLRSGGSFWKGQKWNTVRVVVSKGFKQFIIIYIQLKTLVFFFVLKTGLDSYVVVNLQRCPDQSKNQGSLYDTNPNCMHGYKGNPSVLL